MRRWPVALLFTVGSVAACHAGSIGDPAGNPSGSGGPSGPGSTGSNTTSSGPDPCSLYSCDNTIDAVLVPMIVGGGYTPTTEDDQVLCRRMAIDLTGIAPTSDELANQCAGKKPGDIADYFMNKPSGVNVPPPPAGEDAALYTPYVYVNRRWWADNFQYGGFNVYIRDLDRWVGKLYAGQIGYDELARRALSSQAFLERFGGDVVDLDQVNIANNAIRIFLGRQALPEEAKDFGNLFHGWTSQGFTYLSDTEINDFDTMVYGDQCKKNPDDGTLDCNHAEFGLDGDRCDAARRVDCQSLVFGPTEMVPIDTPDDQLEAWTVEEASHSSNLPRHFVRVGMLGAADLASILVPGNTLIARPEFPGAAVDAALVKYLRWWKSGAYRPDFDVPAIRDALAKKFVTDGYDVRKLEREIVTSLIYTQKAAAVPGASSLTPLWMHGPTKPLYAEAWIDTIGQAIGTKLWNCDFRYEDISEYDHFQDTGIPDQFSEPDTDYGFYPGVVKDLGGCPDESQHADPSGLVASISRRSALERVCKSDMAPLFVPASGATFDSLIDVAFQGIGRKASDDERKTIKDAMSVTGDDGCDPSDLSKCDMQGLSSALCRSIYATALFNFY